MDDRETFDFEREEEPVHCHLRGLTHKAGHIWKSTTDIINLPQLILLGVMLYMLPSIVRTLFDIVSTTVKALAKLTMLALFIGLTTVLYLGNASEIFNIMLSQTLAFSKKAIRDLVAD